MGKRLKYKCRLCTRIKFMIQNNGGTLIRRDEVIFFKSVTYTPIQAINFKIKGRQASGKQNSYLKNQQTCCKDCKNKDQCCKEQEYNEEYEEDYDIREKDYTLTEIGIEFYNFQTGIEKIGTIRSPKDLDNVVKILDQKEIIGEKSLQYLENNKVYVDWIS